MKRTSPIIRARWIWISWFDNRLVVWLCIGGHKPLAHLPAWRRRAFHLPAIRYRLWPRRMANDR